MLGNPMAESQFLVSVEFFRMGNFFLLRAGWESWQECPLPKRMSLEQEQERPQLFIEDNSSKPSKPRAHCPSQKSLLSAQEVESADNSV